MECLAAGLLLFFCFLSPVEDGMPAEGVRLGVVTGPVLHALGVRG